MPAITLNRLRKQFGLVQAVRDISVTFADGAMTSVLGPSGCGKSTTLNMIAGFVTPDAGSIHFGERVIADPARRISVPPHKRELGMVFQSYALWPHLNIAENVGYGLKMRGIGRAHRQETVRRVLARVRLEAVIDRYPHELSGGQQQRIALARALAYSPKILLFDEPLSNLDAQLREEMREELKTLHHEIGVTAVYVTHDQSEAMSLSDVIVVMGDGEILQSGSPRQLYEEPADARVAKIIGKANLLGVSLVEANGARSIVCIPGVAGTVHCRAPSDVAKRPGWLSVRPHGVKLAPAASGADGIIGKIASVTYLGAVCRYEIVVADQKLEALQSGSQSFAVGDAALVAFDADYCYFIPGRDDGDARESAE